MLLLDQTDIRPVHFIGIAGAGMSALAELLVSRGIPVTGSDSSSSGAPDLTRMGVTVTGHDPALVVGARAVVFSSAIPHGHPEMVAARALGVPLIRRAEALAETISGGTVVSVAGTHGKTTTTVMTTEAFASAGLDPVGVAGGRVGRWNGNLRHGNGNTVVVEADEYDRSFLALDSTVAVVLNVEADHLDIYRDLDDIERAFEQFLTPARTVIRCADDAGAMVLRVRSNHDVIAYSATAPGTLPAATSDAARIFAREVTATTSGMSYTAIFDDKELGVVKLSVPGIHNVRNSLAALAAGISLGAQFDALAAGIEQFTGVERRFQRVGVEGGVTVVDDYAHHPTEVAATLAAARLAFPESRIHVAFQPHLYSRTRDLQREFAEALSAADSVYLCDIYGAREQPISQVTSALIGNRLRNGVLKFSGARGDVAAAMVSHLKSGDVAITMGAGDITRSAAELLEMLRSNK